MPLIHGDDEVYDAGIRAGVDAGCEEMVENRWVTLNDVTFTD